MKNRSAITLILMAAFVVATIVVDYGCGEKSSDKSEAEVESLRISMILDDDGSDGQNMAVSRIYETRSSNPLFVPDVVPAGWGELNIIEFDDDDCN